MPSLRHSSDHERGFARRRRGRGWQFVDDRGDSVTRRATLARLRELPIPPAWRDVWICRSARGHLQATGIDAAGRKQYLYHPQWREERDRTKHERVLRFATTLPALRGAVARDLRRGGGDRDAALAAAVRLLDRTWIRVGGERYAGAGGTFGLATLRSRHLRIDDDLVVIDFEGKGGKRHVAEVSDPMLADTLAEMDALPGYEVLKYRDDAGETVDVRSDDINAYIKMHAGDLYTAKDFRTWAATVMAASALDRLRDVPPGRGRVRAVAAACVDVAECLNNTPAVCRRSYIDPRVIDHYLEGRTISAVARRSARPVRGQSSLEARVLALLRRPLDGDRTGD